MSTFALIAALLWPALAGGAAPDPQRAVKLFVDIRYYYGQWNWGDFRMAPRAGIAGPDLRLEFFAGRLALTSAYQSGSFSARGALPLDDPRFHSRKNFDLSDNREAFEIGLEYRLHPVLALAAVYIATQYELAARIDLNSDQRLYGNGDEEATNEARGVGLGIRPHLRLGRRLAFDGAAFYFPHLRARGAGSYRYQMFYRSGGLDERWFGETEVDGFRVLGELTYGLSGVPIALSAGYFYQRFEESQASAPGWLDAYLLGQSENRSWLKDEFYGFTARAGFAF